MQEKKKSRPTWVVARFEFRSLVTSRSYQVSLLISCLLLIIFLSFPKLSALVKKENVEVKGHIGLVNNTDYSLNLDLAQAAIPQYKLQEGKWQGKEEIFQAIDQENLFGVLRLENAESFQWLTDRQPFSEHPEEDLFAVIKDQVQIQVLEEQGLAPTAAAQLVHGPQLETLDRSAESGMSQEQTHLYTYILVFVLYMVILAYGQMTAVSVAYEKGSRTMELLITSAKPRQLVDGKVLGTGLAGLFSMVLFGLVYLVFYRINQASYEAGSFFDVALNMPAHVFLMAVLTFILSYLCLAYLFAGLGSLVSRSEEVNQVIAPLTMLIVVIFLLAIAGTFTPEKTWVAIVSFVPFIGPLPFFVRYSMLGLPVWQILLAIVIHSLTIVACSLMAGRLYRRGTLTYGKVPGFKEIFKMMKTTKADNQS